MKIAVIGSGASAHAVLVEIGRQGIDAEVHVYEAPEPQAAVTVPQGPENYAEVYRYLKAHEGLRFPPPKLHFGPSVDSRPVVQASQDWQRPGGLTNYWGATCLPFSEREWQALGLSRAQLNPYYQRVAAILGIGGDRDSPFARQLQHDFIQAPPFHRLPLFERLDAAINHPARLSFQPGATA